MKTRHMPISALALLIMTAPALAQASVPAAASPATPLPVSAAIPALTPPDCVKPDAKRLEMRPGNDSSAVVAYNAQVHRYNRLSKAFTACTKAYADKVGQDIAALRAKTNTELQTIVKQANTRIRTIAQQVNMAVEAGNQAAAGNTVSVPPIANPDTGFPPSTCAPPDHALLAETSSHRAQRKAADRYDVQYKAFNACTAKYIDAGQATIRKIKADTASDQKATLDHANQRIALLNRLVAQATDGANDLAAKTTAELDASATGNRP
jgi:hypothetical protein